MRKCSLILTVMLLVLLTIPAYAAGTVETRNAATPTLSFEGTTAKCNVICRGDSANDRITATLTLYHEGEYVDSWSASGSFRVPVSGECEVVSGETYVLELTWYVNGSLRLGSTITRTCP